MKNNYLQKQLIDWFAENSRDLPWRRTYLPYHIWISEIMLQQTQMDRVVEYFNRWTVRFLDIESITYASEDEILKLWEGLGYYRRVKNIAKTALILVNEFGGQLPGDHKTLLKLPGIGPYTAGAIMSLAFNREYPIVDGNVERVFARIFDIDRPVKERKSRTFIWQKAEELIPKGKAREFNQSIMELGAMICTPRNPQCEICPVRDFCESHAGDVVEKRPVPGDIKKSIPVTMVAGILARNGKLLIRKRPEGVVWGGLWEFPGGRLKKREVKERGLAELFYETTGFEIEVTGKIGRVQHTYTVHRVTLYGYSCILSQADSVAGKNDGADYSWVDIDDLDRYAFSSGQRKLISKYLQNLIFSAETADYASGQKAKKLQVSGQVDQSHQDHHDPGAS